MVEKLQFNFTEKNLASLQHPAGSKYKMFHDTTQPGLCVMTLAGGTKTYFFYMKFKGTPVKVKIARVGSIKLVEARQKAADLYNRMSHDIDPSEERRDELKDITLKQFYDNQYKPRHSIPYKRPKSIQKDDSMFNNYLKSLHNRKMMSIKTSDLEHLHNELRDQISPYTANRTLTLIKHMYTKAHEWGYPERHKNPADGIKMFAEKSRDRFLQSDEIQRFFNELQNEQNEMFRDFILLSLFVGQRKMNMLSVCWSDVDLENGFIYFPDTKNGESQRIPLTKYSIELLQKMRQRATGKYLFPSATSKSGHIEDFHRPWYALLKRADIENFRFHDIRRTFGSYQAISGASLQVIGKSLGHKSSGATAVYSRLTADPVRDSMERGTERMLDLVTNNKAS